MMGFSINTDVNVMKANLHSSNTEKNLNKTLEFVATGNKLVHAANDASSLHIANELSAQIAAQGRYILNANDSIGMIQIADGAMQGVNDNLERIKVLTLKASNATMSDESRAAIQKEINALMNASNDLINSTSYNGKKLFSENLDTQSFSIDMDNLSRLNSQVDVSSSSGVDAAFETIESLMQGVQQIRTDLGASQNGLLSEIQNRSITQVNTAAAESNLRDVDFSQESANFTRENMMSQVGLFVQSQSNLVTANVARLLQ